MNPTDHHKGTILVVDDTPTNLDMLVDYFSTLEFEVYVATDGESAIEQISHARPDIILLDVMMPGIDGFETCRRLKQQEETANIPVIFMTALSDTAEKVKGFQVGAVDYVTKPIQQEEVLARVTTHLTVSRLQKSLQEANEALERRVAERTADLSQANDSLQKALADVDHLKSRLQAENKYLLEEIKSEHDFDDIIGNSESLKIVLRQVEKVGPTDSTVIIFGETGTGKELFARAIHCKSGRRDRPLVKVNCAAISAGLVESELFGHEKGAFTTAFERRIGRFELANGGTIFLDEVGEVAPETQVKLLRVLQEQEFERVGSSRTIRVDVRVIAATNRDLAEAVRAGAFRSDLFYRLNIFPITLPPLRQRKDDIPILVKVVLEKLAKRLGKPLEGVSQESMDRLMRYTWSGNVRELINVIERAAILSRGPVVYIEDTLTPGISTPEPDAGLVSLQEMERAHITRVLNNTKGVIEGQQGAAAVLGLHPNTLRSRLQKLGIKIMRSPT